MAQRLPRHHGSVIVVVVLSVGLAAGGMVQAAPASADIAQEIKDGQAQLDQLDRASEAAAERYNAGRIQLASARRTADVAQAALSREDAALNLVRSQVGLFAAQLYRNGPGGAALDLVTTGSANTYLQQVSALNEISAGQSRVLAAFSTAKLRDATAAATAKDAVHTAEATVLGLDKDKAAVEEAATKAQQVLAVLQVKQAQLVQAAKDAAARQAAQARAAELATEARNAAAAAAAFQASPLVDQPSVPTVQHHYSGNAAQIAVKVAMDQLGKSYVYGADGPDHFDCSGLTKFAYAQAGINLPHYTGDQYNQGQHVTESELQPGDLVFFEKSLGHVGMYLGNGRFIHAPHTGDVVKISTLSGYYQTEYAGAVRLG